MPQPKRKPAAKRAAKKKPAKKAAAKKPAAQKPEVNRVTTTQTKNTGEPDPQVSQDLEQIQDNEETQEERDAAGEARRQKVSGSQKEPVEPYEPTRLESPHADFDHKAAEEKRQAELQAERDEHNRRTGDGSRS